MKNYTIHLLKRNVIQNKLNAYHMYINRNIYLIAVRIEQYSYTTCNTKKPNKIIECKWKLFIQNYW